MSGSLAFIGHTKCQTAVDGFSVGWWAGGLTGARRGS